MSPRPRHRGRAALRALRLAVLLPALHCAASNDASREDEIGTVASELVLERFPSIGSAETGVHHWDAAEAKTAQERFFVARGFTAADGARTPVIEIVARAGARRGWTVRGGIVLSEDRTRAIARDFEAMAKALGAAEKAQATVGQRSLGIRACGDDAGGGGLVGDCPTQLLDCASELGRGGAAASAAAAALEAEPAAGGAPVPDTATLAEGGPPPSSRCARSGWLEPNDVSVLTSFRRGQPGFGRLLPLAELVSPSLFAQVTDAAVRVAERAHYRMTNPDIGASVWATSLELPVAGPNGRAPLGASTLANWRIVSFRFDPCAVPSPHLVAVPTRPAVDDGVRPIAMIPPPYDAEADRANVERCTVELRLVAQPFRYYDPEPQAREGDTTMHLFYRYGAPGQPDTAARDEILRTLHALKEASPVPTSGALSVHPGLAADRDGRFTALVTDALRRLTSRTRLSQIAFMGLRDPVIVNDAKLRGLDGGPDMWNFFFGVVDGDRFTQRDIDTSWSFVFDGQRGQYRAGSDNVETVNLAGGSGHGQPRTRLSRADVENADVHVATVRNADCVSCHLRDRETRLVNFGHLAGTPAIARRTVVETDAVVRAVQEMRPE